MVTKLKFKGDKPKKRKLNQDEAGKQGSGSNIGENEEEGWVDADTLDDISTGPLFITFASSPPVAVASDPLGKVCASVIKLPNDEEDLSNARPDDVRQVWIATRLAESGKISLKTATGKFLSCDRVGILSATREAIGPQEEWSPIHREDGWVLQNVHEKFLSVDEVTAGGKIEIRGDADSVGFNETFTLRVQARLRKKAKTVATVPSEPKFSKRELEKIAGHSLTDEQVKMLRRAKKEGHFSGALLDIRAKSKSDKYA